MVAITQTEASPQLPKLATVSSFTEKYDLSQQERKVALNFNKGYYFQKIPVLLAHLGFYGKKVDNEVTTPLTVLALSSKIENYQTEEDPKEKELLEKINKMGEILAKAEYLTPDLPEISLNISESVNRSNLDSSEHLLNYESPRILEITFKASQMFYLAGKNAGFSEAILNELMFDSELQRRVMPKKYRELSRRNDAVISYDFPIGKDDQRSAQEIFKVDFKLLQQKIIDATNIAISVHGWTGSWDMIRSLEPEIETDLSEAFFANLTTAERESAVSLAVQGLDDFTNKVSMENGFGPMDYAQDLSILISSLGLAHQFKKTDTNRRTIAQDLHDRTITFMGHSMGGGALLHILTNLRNQIQRGSKIKFVFGMFHPAIIGESSEDRNVDSKNKVIHNTHHWSNAELSNEDISYLEQILQNVSALLVSGGSLTLKNILTEQTKVLKPIYKYPEALVGTLLSEFQLLRGEKIKKRAKAHQEQAAEDTEAATFTAVGSNFDLFIQDKEISKAFSEENLPNAPVRHNEFIVSADGLLNKDRMVNTKQTLLSLPADVPLFVIENGTHYAFKWRTHQFAMDMLTHTARKLERSEWQFFNKIVKTLYDKRKAGGFQDLFSDEIFSLLNEKHASGLKETFDLSSKILLDYLFWRKQYQDSLKSESAIQIFENSNDQELVNLAKKARTLVPPQILLKWLYRNTTKPFIDLFIREPHNDFIQYDLKDDAVQDKLMRLEQLIRCVDICANMAHFNDEMDPIITRNWFDIQDKSKTREMSAVHFQEEPRQAQ